MPRNLVRHWVMAIAALLALSASLGDDAGFTLNAEMFGDPVRFSVASHVIGDPSFAGRPGMKLAFDCKGGFTDRGLTVRVVEHDWTPRARTYTATVHPSPRPSPPGGEGRGEGDRTQMYAANGFAF